MPTIGDIDTTVFYTINHLPHGWLGDGFFGMLSGLGDSGFIWFVIGIWLIIREEKRDKHFFLPLAITGILSWFFSEVLVKSIVARIRPSNILEGVISVGFPNGYSFPSSHATLAFALAVVLTYKKPRFKKFFFSLAILIGFSRIYLGYHFPGDVLAGAVLGTGIGFGVMMGYQYIKKRRVASRPISHMKKKKHTKRTH